jgi:hypothetical protein
MKMGPFFFAFFLGALCDLARIFFFRAPNRYSVNQSALRPEMSVLRGDGKRVSQRRNERKEKHAKKNQEASCFGLDRRPMVRCRSPSERQAKMGHE